MPAGPQPAHPAGLAEGHEVLGQPRDRLERGERAVGEALGQAALLHEGVGEVGRIGDPAPGDADGDDRHDAQAEGDAGRDRRPGEPERADRQGHRRGRVAVRRGQDGVEEADREGGEPERRQPAGQVGRRDAAGGEGGRDRDRGDEERRPRVGRRGEGHAARRWRRPGWPAGWPARAGSSRRDRSGSGSRSRARPPRSGRRRGARPGRPRSAAKRRSWVAATTAVPSSTRAANEGEQALVAAAVLAERRLVEHEEPWPAHELGGQGESPLLPAGQGERVPRAEPVQGEAQRRGDVACPGPLVERQPEEQVGLHRGAQERPLGILRHVAGEARELPGGDPGRVAAGEADGAAGRAQEADEEAGDASTCRCRSGRGGRPRSPGCDRQVEVGQDGDPALEGEVDAPGHALGQAPAPRGRRARDRRAGPGRGRQARRAARCRPPTSAGPCRPAARAGVPSASGVPSAAEGEDQVGEGPREVRPVLHEDDRRRPRRRGPPPAARRRPGRRAGRGWPSARRGRGGRDGARRRRPGPGAAARRPRAGPSGAARTPPRPASASAAGTRARIAGRSQRAALQPERDVVLRPLHDELAGRILEDDPDPGGRGPPGRWPATRRPSRRRSPSSRPGTAHGTSPAIARASVLLPEPDGPTTRRQAPGARSNETPATAGAARPG